MRVGESERRGSRGRSVWSSEEFKPKSAHVGIRTAAIEVEAMPQMTLGVNNDGLGARIPTRGRHDVRNFIPTCFRSALNRVLDMTLSSSETHSTSPLEHLRRLDKSNGPYERGDPVSVVPLGVAVYNVVIVQLFAITQYPLSWPMLSSAYRHFLPRSRAINSVHPGPDGTISGNAFASWRVPITLPSLPSPPSLTNNHGKSTRGCGPFVSASISSPPTVTDTHCSPL